MNGQGDHFEVLELWCLPAGPSATCLFSRKFAIYSQY